MIIILLGRKFHTTSGSSLVSDYINYAKNFKGIFSCLEPIDSKNNILLLYPVLNARTNK